MHVRHGPIYNAQNCSESFHDRSKNGFAGRGVTVQSKHVHKDRKMKLWYGRGRQQLQVSFMGEGCGTMICLELCVSMYNLAMGSEFLHQRLVYSQLNE